MNEFVIRPEDEMTHDPGASVNFNESVYTNGFNAASPVGGWMRLGNRVHERYAELSVCLYLPDGRIACQFQRPSITSNDRFNAGGLSYAVIEPLKKVSMRFDGEMLIVDNPDAFRDPKTLFEHGRRVPGHVHWVHEGEGPVHGGAPANDAVQTMYGRDFSFAHFNQHARVRGEIKVGDETFTIDGHGWRDHSWGPRYWQAIYFYRLFVANFPNGDGFMLLKITGKDGVTRRVGLLLVDGQYEEILDMDCRRGGAPKKTRSASTSVCERRTAKRLSPVRSSRWRHYAIGAKPTARFWNHASPKALRASLWTAAKVTA